VTVPSKVTASQPGAQPLEARRRASPAGSKSGSLRPKATGSEANWFRMAATTAIRWVWAASDPAVAR